MAQPKLSDLKSKLTGKLILPGSAEYDEARRVFNAMINKYPAAISYCENNDDIIACLEFANTTGTLLSIRSGGHSAGGFGVWDDALVVDLSHFKKIEIDTAKKIAIIQCGCTLGEIDKATHEHGYAIASGVNSLTGIGGLTLGGGLGYLTRKHGLSIDNLLEAEIILADGRVVRASEDLYEDLFWAIRGGGGNFGVVTSFTFRLHPISLIYGGPMFWPIERAKEILRWFRDYTVNAPEDINCFFAFLTIPPAPQFPDALHFKKMCAIIWCYLGPPEKTKDVFNPIRQQLKPVLDLVGQLPFPILQCMFDGAAPKGMQMYWKADYINELPDEAIDLQILHGNQLPTLLSTSHIYCVNGAAGRIKSDSTAWSYRSANWSQVIVGVDPDPANNGQITQWVKSYWTAVHPYSAGGAYINFLTEGDEDTVSNAYGRNLEKLRIVKTKYDPKNLFRINFNIKPLT